MLGNGDELNLILPKFSLLVLFTFFLDRFQYRFQPIKFVNMVVPSPCESVTFQMKAIEQYFHVVLFIMLYLDLISRTGGLYGKFLTKVERSEVCKHDRGQDSTIQTD